MCVNDYQNKPSLDLSHKYKDPLCIVDEHLDDDCISWIKLAEGLNVDGVLESWGKIKPVSWKLGMKKLEMIGLKRTWQFGLVSIGMPSRSIPREHKFRDLYYRNNMFI